MQGPGREAQPPVRFSLRRARSRRCAVRQATTGLLAWAEVSLHDASGSVGFKNVCPENRPRATNTPLIHLLGPLGTASALRTLHRGIQMSTGGSFGMGRLLGCAGGWPMDHGQEIGRCCFAERAAAGRVRRRGAESVRLRGGTGGRAIQRQAF